MKKKLMTIVICTMLCAALFAGCGRAEEKELTGTIDEIVKYTGTISEVDPFEGEVISVEKTE